MKVQKGDPEGAIKEGTAGGNPKRIEVALRYGLQMATLTLAVAGESEATRTVERLRGIVATAGVRLSQKGCHVGRGCKRGVARCAPHTWTGTRYTHISDGVGRSRVPRRWRKSFGKGYKPK